MKLRKLRILEKAYDALYDLNNNMQKDYTFLLDELEKEAGEYGYKLKVNSYDKWKLYSMTKKEFDKLKVENGL